MKIALIGIVFGFYVGFTFLLGLAVELGARV